MKFSVTVSTDYITFGDFFKKNVFVLLFIARNNKSFFVRISVMKIQTCRMLLFAIFAFIATNLLQKPEFYFSSPSLALFGVRRFSFSGFHPFLFIFSPTILASWVLPIFRFCFVSKTIQIKNLFTFIAFFHASMYSEHPLKNMGVLNMEGI